MTEFGADPWPTESQGPYADDASGASHTTTMTKAPDPEALPEGPPIVLPSTPIVVSPEPTVAVATPGFVPPAPSPDDDYTSFGTPPPSTAPISFGAPPTTTFGTPPTTPTFEPGPAEAPTSPAPPAPPEPLAFEPTATIAPVTAFEPTATIAPVIDAAPPPTPAFQPVAAAAPQPPGAPAYSIMPLPATGQQVPNSERRWNWAAGCVIGLSILCFVFAGPQFATAVHFHKLGDQSLGDWLLYGAALGSLLTVICLASRSIAVVAVLSLATAAVGMAAVFKLQDDWNLSHYNSWASLGLVIGFGLLGLASSAGLRRHA